MKPLILIFCFLPLGLASAAGERLGVGSVADVIWAKFDEYSNIPFTKEKQRLKNFDQQLRAESTATAYIVAHAGRLSCEGEAQARAERVKQYLIRTGHIEASRIRIIDAGYKEQWLIELYIGPLNAPPLTANIIRNTHSEVPPEQLQIVRNCVGKFSGVLE
jgi:hypothetical protein